MTPAHMGESQGDLNSEGNKAPLMEKREKEQRVRQTEKREKEMPEQEACDVRVQECKPRGRQTRGEPEESAEREKSGWKDQERE